MLRKLVSSGCYNIPWTCTHVWCYANVHTCLMLRKLVASGCEMSWLWNGSIVEMSWLWSSKRKKKTEIEDSELTSQQRSRPYCLVIINDFGVTIGNRLEIVLFFLEWTPSKLCKWAIATWPQLMWDQVGFQPGGFKPTCQDEWIPSFLVDIFRALEFTLVYILFWRLSI